MIFTEPDYIQRFILHGLLIFVAMLICIPLHIGMAQDRPPPNSTEGKLVTQKDNAVQQGHVAGPKHMPHETAG